MLYGRIFDLHLAERHVRYSLPGISIDLKLLEIPPFGHSALSSLVVRLRDMHDITEMCIPSGAQQSEMFPRKGFLVFARTD